MFWLIEGCVRVNQKISGSRMGSPGLGLERLHEWCVAFLPLLGIERSTGTSGNKDPEASGETSEEVPGRGSEEHGESFKSTRRKHS